MFAFRRAIELMVLNNTCECNACANVSALDLKLFLHHGAFALQKVGQREELFGNDVVLAHRLLKNTITNDTGTRAYAAYTEAALASLGEELRETMARVELVYDDIGAVTVWVQDLHPVWETRHEDPIVNLEHGDVDLEFSFQLSIPPEIVWDYLNDPGSRHTFSALTEWTWSISTTAEPWRDPQSSAITGTRWCRR